MGGDDDGVLVVLVEDDDLDPGGGAPLPGGPDDAAEAARVRSRHRRRLLAASAAGVLLAVTAVVGGAMALDEHRLRERRDALAALGVPLVDLAAPLDEVWRVEGESSPMALTDDVVVLQTPGGDMGSPALVAVATATGERLWERGSPASSCSSWNPAWNVDGDVPSYTIASAQVGALGPEPPTWLVCVSGDYWGLGASANAVTAVEVLALRDGEALATVEVDGAAVSMDLLGPDAVVLSVDGDGTLVATRMDLLTGESAWVVPLGKDGLDEEGGFAGWWAELRGGAWQLQGPDGTRLALDVATGAEREPDGALTYSPALLDLPDGGRVEMRYEVSSSADGYGLGVEHVAVIGPDGVERFSHEGSLWSPWLTDGSMSDRVVVAEPGQVASELVALDVEDGHVLWRQAMTTWSWGVVQVDGVAVAAGADVRGVDLSTGEERWRIEAGTSTVGYVTDGRRALAALTRPDGTSLVAVDIASGEQVWSLPLAQEPWWVIGAGDGVLVASGGATVLYR